MSYRKGVYVVDRRTNRVGEVMDTHGTYMQLRPPRGGAEWDCPPTAVRLATQAERRAAGIAANGAARDHAEWTRR